jgi:outer membrane protein TolC
VKRPLIFLAIALLACGCATYHAQPLDGRPAVLAPPVAAVLERAAEAIDRPYLPPVQVDLAAPLSPDAIAALAVIGNPDLKALRLRAGVADAQAFMAGLLPDPTFSWGIDRILSGPDAFDNIAASLGLDLNALRTRTVSHERARAEARQVRLDLAWAEWQTAGRARIQAARVLGLERQLILLRASVEASRLLLQRSMRAAVRGDIDAGQVEAARLAAADLADRRRVAERDLNAARQELLRLIGFPPDAPIQLLPTELSEAPLDAATLFALARRERTDLQALQEGYAAQEAAVHKAVLDQFPTLDLTINATRDTGNNRLLGPAVGFTLPLWNRNRGGIAVERATRDALKAEYESRLFQARADIFAAVSGVEIAWAQRRQMLADLPELMRLSEASQAAAARGDVSLAAVLVAQQALRDTQQRLEQNDQDIREQTIALELLTGVPQGAWTR